MTVQRKGSRRGLAAACVIWSSAAGVAVADAPFDYTLWWNGYEVIDGASSVTQPDPELCGTASGWTETFSTRIETRVKDLHATAIRSRLVRRGTQLGGSASRARLHGDPWKFSPATFVAEYTGCVVPSGKVLVSFSADVTIHADEGQQRFVVIYAGPPVPIPLSSESDLSRFEVRADAGEAMVSRFHISPRTSFSSDPHKLPIYLRLQSKGATE